MRKRTRRSGAELADGHIKRTRSADDRRPARSRDIVDNVVRPLEVVFDAAVARDEELAADDLALSLDQDRTLEDVVTRASRLTTLRLGGRARPVARIGVDYVETMSPGSEYMPLDQAIYRVDGSGEAIEPLETSFLEILRTLVRAHAFVELETREGKFTGTLARARRDHLQLGTATDTLIVPYAVLVSVSVRRGG